MSAALYGQAAILILVAGALYMHNLGLKPFTDGGKNCSEHCQHGASSAEDLYTQQCKKKANRIIRDSSHPRHKLLRLLQSDRW